MEPKLLKRREREIQPEIEKVAKKACLEAAKEEVWAHSEDGIIASYGNEEDVHTTAWQVMVLILEPP